MATQSRISERVGPVTARHTSVQRAAPVIAARQASGGSMLQRRLGNAGVAALLRSPDKQAEASKVAAASPRSVARTPAQTRIVRPTDPSEREAEAVARRVMSKPTDIAAPPKITAPARLARRPAMAEPSPSDPPVLDHETAQELEASQGGGATLPAPIRNHMEHAFQADFSAVRIHTDEQAARLAARASAVAFTYGRHIYFSRGAYKPDTKAGGELIAHELTHTIQQRAAVQRRADDTKVVARAPQLVQRFGISDVPALLAEKANGIPGFRMFTIVLGTNPITMAPVDRSTANVLRAVVEFIPGGALITQALDAYGIFERVGGWIDQQIRTLGITGTAIRAAVTQFIDSLGISDIFSPGDVWDRAVSIFSTPIKRIKDFLGGLAGQVLDFIRDAILRPLANLASQTRAWDLLTAVLGRNPITGEAVPRNADTLIGGFMKLIGQEEVWENLKKSNAVPRAWAWFQGALAGVEGFVSQIPSMFLNTLRSLVIADLVALPSAFARVVGVFANFVGQFISWAGNTVWNLLEIVFDVVSPGALAYIKKTGAALKSILKNPLPFVGNLVRAAKLGLQNFADNFGEHLKTGLIDWLTGSLTGVYIPKALSFAELGRFALSVLGITWAQIRGKIVKALGPAGERIMAGLETTFDVVVALVKGGPAAAWELIKDKLTNLKDMVIEGITSFVVDTIVKKAIPKLVAMFIPGAGFISAILSIYDTVMVFVQKLSKIAAAVMAFVDSIVAIAAGQVGTAANRVEATLSGLLSLAISFLAGFLGLGNVAEKILGVIKKVQALVDRALDAAIGWIVGKAKALFGKLFGKEDKKDGPADENTRKAVTIVQQRVNDLLASGLPRDQLKSKVQGWAGELGVKRVGVEHGNGTDTVFVENSPRYTTNTVIASNVEAIYRMIYDIAKARMNAATTPIKGAAGPWKNPRAITVAPGTDPLTIAKGLQAQGPQTGVGVGYGVGVSIEFAGGKVTAARRSGIANFVITKLGKYPEIAAKLKAKGMSVGQIADAMTTAIKTAQGDPDILRMVSLMHGAEPAREALPAATAPLLLGSALTPDSSLRGGMPEQLFGTGPAGGVDPASPVGARSAMRRAEATLVGGETFPEGTNIAMRTEEHVKAVAQGVFEAVLHMDFRDTTGLRKRVLELIEIYDKAAGVKK